MQPRSLRCFWGQVREFVFGGTTCTRRSLLATVRQQATPVRSLPHTWRVLVSVGVGLNLLGGCMPKRVDLVKTDIVSIHTKAPEYLRLSASAYVEDGTFVVYGNALDRSGARLPPPLGHIDIEVTGPDGKALAAQHVPYRVVTMPRRMRWWYATFRATFATVPPSGAVITLQHHLGVHDSGAAFDRAEAVILQHAKGCDALWQRSPNCNNWGREST